MCQSRELLLTASEIAVHELGSSSGGELRHLSIGVMSSRGTSLDTGMAVGKDGSELEDARCE